MTLETIDYTPREDADDRCFDSIPLYAALRRSSGRSDQDWEDRIHDAIVWIMEHDGTLTNAEGETAPVESPIGLAVAYMRGRVRNVRKRAAILPHDSIDAKGKDDGPSVAEKLAAKDRADARAIIVQALRKLKPLERAVVRLTLSGYTTREIGEKIAHNPMFVSRTAKRALAIMAQ